MKLFYPENTPHTYRMRVYADMPVYTSENDDEEIRDVKKLLTHCIWKGLSSDQMVGLGFRDEQEIRSLCEKHSLDFNNALRMKHIQECMVYCNARGHKSVYHQIRDALGKADGDVNKVDQDTIARALREICQLRKDDTFCKRFILRCIWEGLTAREVAQKGASFMIQLEEEVFYMCDAYGIKCYAQAARFMRINNKGTMDFDEWMQVVEENPRQLSPKNLAKLMSKPRSKVQDQKCKSHLINCIWKGCTVDEVVTTSDKYGHDIRCKTKLKELCKTYNLTFNDARFMRAIRHLLWECKRMKMHDVACTLRQEMKAANKAVRNMDVPKIKKLMQKVHKEMHKNRIKKQ